MAKKYLTWFKNYQKIQSGNFEKGNIEWFIGGKLNACFNCVDRHLPKKANQIALIYEQEEPDQTEKITYQEMKEKVCQTANLLKSLGVKKGDPVAIYMPTCPAAIYTMLACTRIGAIHNVVFGGFSANALRERLIDCKTRIIFTSNHSIRKGRRIFLKKMVDEAIKDLDFIDHVVVHKLTESEEDFHEEKDKWYEESIAKESKECLIEEMDSESPLFMLYTSGSTGQPKGIIHTTGGYLVYAGMTFDYIFDYRENDIHCCVANIGWITGHTYTVYGPLLLGATTVLYEAVPIYPTVERYWQSIDKLKITSFYTSPTAIRLLMTFSDQNVIKYDLSSLRVIGSVGEPINPEAWLWYYKLVGRERCTLVDTYWQTETGGVVLTPLPGVTPLKPGSTTLPFFGISPVILDPSTGNVLTENNVTGLLAISSSWPSIARTIYSNHKQYLNVYFNQYKGFYLTGDSAFRDSDGYYWVLGRIDDVITVSGHRIGSMEIESALVSHSHCVEAAVVGIPHEIRGQAICAFCVLKDDPKKEEQKKDLDSLRISLSNQVATQISRIAFPDQIVFVNALPKTRSGKIMRRILRSILIGKTSQQDFGDTSTLLDPSVIDELIEQVKLQKKQ
ncbi:acetyl-coenzyme a synthetase 1 [Anaeramoeba ignava]|uniref:Acetyl-coenzyme A synthetase n=1 Tax=Anaeramoeba ignava TaxID=1746090 RepID=A0A9Q0RFE1_ANAIG|nr:acetyl-coenzyme a synthetase 1 [Anaeramoeba ignava]